MSVRYVLVFQKPVKSVGLLQAAIRPTHKVKKTSTMCRLFMLKSWRTDLVISEVSVAAEHVSVT